MLRIEYFASGQGEGQARRVGRSEVGDGERISSYCSAWGLAGLRMRIRR